MFRLIILIFLFNFDFSLSVDEDIRLNDYKSGNLPLMFWHVQKSGGTSICEAMVVQQISNNIIPNKGDNCNGPWQEYLQDVYSKNFNKKQMIISKPIIKHQIISIEPAYLFKDSFPKSYHNIMNNILSDSTESGGPFWSTFAHAISIRHPLESSLSAFAYDFAGSRQSILGSCKKRDINIQKCIDMIFEVKENINEHDDVWGNYQRSKIRTHVLGNFLLTHLSSNNDLNEAKRNLNRMSIIVDLSLSTISLDLIQNRLGWNGINVIPKANDVKTKKGRRSKEAQSGVINYLTSNQINKIRSYIKKDEELYEYGLQLMLKHHQNLNKIN